MRQIVLTAACCIGTGLSGCVTDDFDDITRVFDVPTPGEAARWALDQHDPDRRREGLVLLSTASFGGAQVYVDLYRDYVENDPDPLVKSAAIAALARHGTPQDALLIAPWDSTLSYQERHDSLGRGAWLAADTQPRRCVHSG